MMNNFLSLASKLGNEFKNVHLEGLADGIKDAEVSLKQAKKTFGEISVSQKEIISSQLSSIKNGNKYTQTLINSAKSGKQLKDVQADIVKDIDKQVQAQEKAKKATEDQIKSTKTLLTQQQDKALSLTQGGKLNIKSFQTENKESISSQQYEAVKKAYRNAVSSSRKPETAQEKFLKSLQNLNVNGETVKISPKNTSTISNAFIRSFDIINNDIKDGKTELIAYNKQLDKIKSELQSLQQNRTEIISVTSLDEVSTSFNKIADSAREVERAEEQLKTAQDAVIGEDVKENLDGVSESIKKETEAYNENKDVLDKNRESQENFTEAFGKIQDKVKTILSLSTAWRGFRNVLSQTYEDVKVLDKAFAEIAMVTDYSVQDMWNSYDQYAEMAKDLGQTTESVIQASGLYYQQGLETNEALELTESTMKLATLAGLDFKDATSQMTAALRAFHMEMNQGEHITDVYAELAAKAAADVNGIAEAMSKTASIANSAGMSFENTAAFLTQMIETTQEAPENIGTAMKTVIARFTELKENVAGTADSEFDDLDYNKVDKALKSVGVQLKDSSGQFRNLDEVFLELSSKWNTMSRNSQRYVATIAAGSRLSVNRLHLAA